MHSLESTLTSAHCYTLIDIIYDAHHVTLEIATSQLEVLKYIIVLVIDTLLRLIICTQSIIIISISVSGGEWWCIVHNLCIYSDVLGGGLCYSI